MPNERAMIMNYMAIPGLIKYNKPECTYNEILEAVARSSGFTMDELLRVNRQPKRVAARYIAMVSIRKMTGLSLKKIGAIFGKNHTTVIHSQQTVLDAIDVRDLVYMDIIARLLIREGIDLQKLVMDGKANKQIKTQQAI